MDQGPAFDRRRFVTLGLTGAAATAAAATSALLPGTAAARAATAAGTLLAADEFDGAAGSAPNPGIWRFDLGAGGWGNGELETYTDSRRNSQLDGTGNLVITARRRGRRHLHVRPPEVRGDLHGAVRPRRGAHQDPPRPGHLAGVLDARRRHRTGRLAGVRRDRRHGERRVRTRARARHRARTRLLGCERHLRDVPQPVGAAFADDFHVFGVDWRPDSITWTVDGPPTAR